MGTTFDFNPYRRSTVGFDRLFDLLETASRSPSADSYPPFDLRKDSDDRYEIRLAVAGFPRDEIEIVAQQNPLVLRGHNTDAEDDGRFVHSGIAARSFERSFQLADFIEVGEARFEDGLLIIALKRGISEAAKPRRIEIGGVAANDRIAAPSDERQAA